MTAYLHVAAGVIVDGAGRILIAKRPAHVHQGDLWEFPGGKLEPGETPRQALERELHEELAVTVRDAHPLIQIRHAYPERRVLLDVWRVTGFSGEPHSPLGQPWRWVEPDELPAYPFPAANLPIISAARLPAYYAILDDEHGDQEALWQRFRQLQAQGIMLCYLRAKQLVTEHYLELARRICAGNRQSRMAVLLRSDATEQLIAIGADGIHLNAHDLHALRQRPLSSSSWVAASCHTPADLQRAERLGLDFAVLGPVQTTLTHPDATPLGWDKFAAWVEEVNMPVYALGGLRSDDLPQAQRAGGQGVAAIRGFLF